MDWAAYARSELLTVRLYREDVAPRVDLVIDVSRSMAVTEQKRRAHGELAALFACASASTTADSLVITTPDPDPPRLRRPEDIERALACDAAASALEAPHLPLRRRSLRVVVSDFLFPHDADVLVGRLARDGASLSIVQLTLREEAEPEASGGRRLIDVEGRGEIDDGGRDGRPRLPRTLRPAASRPVARGAADGRALRARDRRRTRA